MILFLLARQTAIPSHMHQWWLFCALQDRVYYMPAPDCMCPEVVMNSYKALKKGQCLNETTLSIGHKIDMI